MAFSDVLDEAEATFRQKCYFLEFSVDIRPYYKCRFFVDSDDQANIYEAVKSFDYIKTLLKKECKTYTGGE